MRKSECERVIRYLCGEWAKLRGITVDPMTEPSFNDFYQWIGDNFSTYLTFRTTTSVREDVELWFDQEFKQMWRR